MLDDPETRADVTLEELCADFNLLDPQRRAAVQVEVLPIIHRQLYEQTEIEIQELRLKRKLAVQEAEHQ